MAILILLILIFGILYSKINPCKVNLLSFMLSLLYLGLIPIIMIFDS